MNLSINVLISQKFVGQCVRVGVVMVKDAPMRLVGFPYLVNDYFCLLKVLHI